MPTDCSNCPLRRLPGFENLSPEELEFMSHFKVGEIDVSSGQAVVIEGAKSPQLFTVLDGMGVRFRTLEDGRSQITNFVMPGDFIGMQDAMLDDIGYSIEATTPMTLCVFRRSDIWTLFRNHPERAFDMTWLVCSEEHFLGSALATVGQRSALERVAWALVVIHDRFRQLGRVDNGVFSFPFRQQDLADALGLSLVHTNKTLAKLRDRGLASWAEGVVRVFDREGLRQLAVMDEVERKVRPLI